MASRSLLTGSLAYRSLVMGPLASGSWVMGCLASRSWLMGGLASGSWVLGSLASWSCSALVSAPNPSWPASSTAPYRRQAAWGGAPSNPVWDLGIAELQLKPKKAYYTCPSFLKPCDRAQHRVHHKQKYRVTGGPIPSSLKPMRSSTRCEPRRGLEPGPVCQAACQPGPAGQAAHRPRPARQAARHS